MNSFGNYNLCPILIHILFNVKLKYKESSTKNANQFLDVFIDAAKVTKTYIPTVNTLAKIDIPRGKPMAENESSIACLKRE